MGDAEKRNDQQQKEKSKSGSKDNKMQVETPEKSKIEKKSTNSNEKQNTPGKGKQSPKKTPNGTPSKDSKNQTPKKTNNNNTTPTKTDNNKNNNNQKPKSNNNTPSKPTNNSSSPAPQKAVNKQGETNSSKKKNKKEKQKRENAMKEGTALITKKSSYEAVHEVVTPLEKLEEKLESMEVERFLLRSELQSEVIGVYSNAYEDKLGRLTLTIMNKGIFIYTFHQCVSTLIVPPFIQLTGAAIIYNQQVFVVADYNTLLTCPIDGNLSSAISEKSQTQIHGNIHSIFPQQSATTEKVFFSIAVVCVNSTIIVYDVNLKLKFKLVAKHDTDVVVFSEMISTKSRENNREILVLIIRRGDSFFLEFYQFDVLENACTLAGSHVLNHPSKKYHIQPEIITCAFDYLSRDLVILWNNQELCFYTWNSEASILSKTPDLLKLNFHRKLNAFDIPLNSPHGVVCTFLQPKQFVLAGRKNDSFGENNLNFVIIWHTALGVVEAFFDLDYVRPGSQPSEIPFLNNQQTTLIQALKSYDNSRITFAMSGGVIVCLAVQYKVPSLSTAVGKFELTDSILAADDPLKNLNTANTMTHKEQDFSSLKKLLKENGQNNDFIQFDINEEVWNTLHGPNQKNDVHFNNLINSKITHNSRLFQSELDQFINTKRNGNAIKISQSMTRKIAFRCLQDNFWEPLSYLIRNNILSCSMLPNLAEKLIEHNQIALILEMILHFDDIPEKLSIHFMQYFISHASRDAIIQALSSKSFGGGSHGKLNASSSLSCVLNLIMNYNFNEAILRACIKLLNVKEISVLANHLTTELEKQTTSLKKPSYQPTIIKRDLPFGKAISWMTILFDTHFTQFLLVDELTDFIARYSEIVETHVTICESLNFIDVYTSQVNDSLYLPQHQNTKYEFNVLDLPKFAQI